MDGLCAFISPGFEFEGEMVEAVILHKVVTDLDGLLDEQQIVKLSLLEKWSRDSHGRALCSTLSQGLDRFMNKEENWAI